MRLALAASIAAWPACRSRDGAEGGRDAARRAASDAPEPASTPPASPPARLEAGGGGATGATTTTSATDPVWVTDARDGFEAAFPGLPADQRPVLQTRRGPAATHLVAYMGADHTGFSIHVVPGGEVEEYAASLRGLLVVRRDTPWRARGRAIDLEGRRGVASSMSVRLWPSPAKLYVASSAGAAPDRAEAFFASFSTLARPTARALRHADGRFRVEAPCRMGPWREGSAHPPLVGYMAVLDGNQLVAAFAEVPDTRGAAGLDGAVLGVATALHGTVEQRRDSTQGGMRAARFLVRAPDVVATIRLVAAGRRLVQAAVYAPTAIAPGGQPPVWAARFVDSLVVEP